MAVPTEKQIERQEAVQNLIGEHSVITLARDFASSCSARAIFYSPGGSHEDNALDPKAAMLWELCAQEFRKAAEAMNKWYKSWEQGNDDGGSN